MAWRAGNIAQYLYIRDQTIHIGGEPQWIQALPLDALKAVRDRLHRASRNHEALALIPLLAPLAVAIMAVGIFSLSLLGIPQAARHHAAPTALWLAGAIAIPTWFGLYDVRRRHRRVVESAERRWAELVVEIAAREDAPPREAPVKQLVRWWRAHGFPGRKAINGINDEH